MKLFHTIKSFNLNSFRSFNWKYPFPKEMQPSPPKPDAIDPTNLAEVAKPLSKNDKFNKEYINRNPRNLEQMLLEIKPNGFPIDSPNVVYWNKLYYERTARHTSAKVVHNSGETIVSASTQEWAIRKHLKSSIDDSATYNIARVLAQRCLQSGILFVNKEFTENELQTQKVKLLLETLENEGLKTEEPRAIVMKDDNYK